MISRRRLLLLLGLVGISTRRVVCDNTSAPPPSDEREAVLPPHCEALSLVWSSQGELIRAAELRHAKAEQRKRKEYVSAESRSWFDADARNWEVIRPFKPGGDDSTHLFRVSYLIDGKEVAMWGADTRTKKVYVIK